MKAYFVVSNKLQNIRYVEYLDGMFIWYPRKKHGNHLNIYFKHTILEYKPFVCVDLSAVVVGWKYKPCALCWCRLVCIMCRPVLHASRHAEAALGRAPVSWWPPCQPAELATSSSAFTSILALKQSEAVRESEEGAMSQVPGTSNVLFIFCDK